MLKVNVQFFTERGINIFANFLKNFTSTYKNLVKNFTSEKILFKKDNIMLLY